MKVTIIAFIFTLVHISCAFDGDIVGLLKLTPAEKEEATEALRNCYAEENATQEDVAKLNDKSKCLLKCFFLKLGSLQEDGSFDMTRVKSAFNKWNYKVGEICTEMATSKNLCQKSYEAFSCYLRHHKD